MTTQAPDLMGQAIQFRMIMDQPIGEPTLHTSQTQRRLITEEYEEFIEAWVDTQYTSCTKENNIDALKELADLVYVCFQYAAAAGWELDEALDRIHESNLSKLVDGKPVKRDDGKVLKGPNYKPPYLDDLV